MRKPEDQSELELWMSDPITRWFFYEMLQRFEPHTSILWAEDEKRLYEVIGEQKVMKFFRNPGDLM